jgi:putative glycosyltransferase (TIGR04372 family)
MAALDPDATGPTVQDQRNIHQLRTATAALLNSIGKLDLADRFGRETSLIAARAQLRLYGQDFRVFSDRWTAAVGHMVILACLIAGRRLNYQGARQCKICTGPVANQTLLRMILEQLGGELTAPDGHLADGHSVQQFEWVDGRFLDYLTACSAIADAVGDERGAILSAPDRSDPRIQSFLSDSGLGRDARIVTLHCREGGYRQDARHDLRNAPVSTFLPALRWLTDRGYTVVRMGDRSMSPIDGVPGVVDYANSTLKSQDLDVLLPAVAEFHIGTSSGLSLVPLLFATPCLFLNWYPVVPLPWGRRTWTVLKPVRKIGGDQVTDPARLFRLGRIIHEPLLRASGYEVGSLSAEHIIWAVEHFSAHLALEHSRQPEICGQLWISDSAAGLRRIERPPSDVPGPTATTAVNPSPDIDTIAMEAIRTKPGEPSEHVQ